MSPTRRLIAVDILTAGFRIVGKVEASTSSGLVGLFNDDTRSYITIYEAAVARIHRPTKLIARYSKAELAKRGIHAACVSSQDALGPPALLRGGFKTLMEYKVFAASSIFEYHITIRWSGKFDPMAILVQGRNDFLPAYNGTVRAIFLPALNIKAPAMLVNRRKIDICARVK